MMILQLLISGVKKTPVTAETEQCNKSGNSAKCVDIGDISLPKGQDPAARYQKGINEYVEKWKDVFGFSNPVVGAMVRDTKEVLRRGSIEKDFVAVFGKENDPNFRGRHTLGPIDGNSQTHWVSLQRKDPVSGGVSDVANLTVETGKAQPSPKVTLTINNPKLLEETPR